MSTFWALNLATLLIIALSLWAGVDHMQRMRLATDVRPVSRPIYYGIYIGFWGLGTLCCTLPPLLYSGHTETHPGITWGASLALTLLGLGYAYRNLSPDFRAREAVESAMRRLLLLAATTAIFITFAIILSLFFETVRFFNTISILDFLTGQTWNPRTTLTPGGDPGTFGMLPLFVGTLLITGIALCVALPVGLFVAIYMAEYARPQTRSILKPLIEMLAGIPTIVYGFFAIVAVIPLLQKVGIFWGVEISPQSALGVGIVMGVMIVPFISSLSDDAFKTVPKALRENSLALGATSSETIKYVVLPAAMPGIIAACLLAVSRAIGETMLVVMAAGLTSNLTLNPLESVTTVTVQIVSLLTGDQEFDSPKTLSAFALGFILFLSTLLLNIIALRVARKYREKYD